MVETRVRKGRVIGGREENFSGGRREYWEGNETIENLSWGAIAEKYLGSGGGIRGKSK